MKLNETTTAKLYGVGSRINELKISATNPEAEIALGNVRELIITMGQAIGLLQDAIDND